jgi:peptidoglycan hydrolase-like protein with peptidoglycan-binding domain
MLVRDDAPPVARPRRPRAVAAAAGVLALAAGGWLGMGALRGDGGGGPAEPPGAQTATATLERRTLVERESVDGTLGYAGTRTLVNRLAGSGAGSGSGSGTGTESGTGSGSGSAGSGSAGTGTVTWLAAPGAVVRRGGVLYRLDDRPVVLMDGRVPAYRRMAPGIARGPDVLQLERNLVALGFGVGVTVDTRYTSATAAAVKRWQRARGLPRTGTVELGQIVFMSGPRRVGERRAAIGTAVGDGGEVLTTTSTRRVVAVELDVAKQSLVRVGGAVRVTLPDGSEVGGRIAAIARSARAKDAGGDEAGDGEGGEQELVVDVSVALSSSRRAARLDRAPVTVDIARQVERDVLAAPVTALVAREGGGYGLEVVDRAGRGRTVPVRTGFFADGYVEVSGSGIRAGTRVAVPE